MARPKIGVVKTDCFKSDFIHIDSTPQANEISRFFEAVKKRLLATDGIASAENWARLIYGQN